jgi:lipopolysaccharide export system permease protein
MIEAPKNQFFGITIYKLNENFGLYEEVEAKEMRYEAGNWVLLNGMHRRFFADGRIDLLPFSQEPVELNKTPDEFKQIKLHHEEMSYPELANYVTRLKREGYHFTRYAVDLHQKMAFPFASFVMAVLAIPFALWEGIRTNLIRGIGLSLLIGVCYWIILSMILSLGHSGILPPLLSAWLANILFLALGTSLFLSMRQ